MGRTPHELESTLNEAWARAISAPTADEFLRFMTRIARLEDEFAAVMASGAEVAP